MNDSDKFFKRLDALDRKFLKTLDDLDKLTEVLSCKPKKKRKPGRK